MRYFFFPWIVAAIVIVFVPNGQAAPKTHTNSIGMKFVLVPAGSFWMGTKFGPKVADNELPQHRVTISKSFYLGKYEVTQGQWEAVMGSNPSEFKGGNRPVEKVSWEDIRRFVRRLNAKEGVRAYRLPTEAEWEYACRAGTTTPFHFGNTISADTQANYDGNHPYGNGSKGRYRKTTTPVGSFPANRFGLHDMHGNVREWVQDVYKDTAYDSHAAKDPIYEGSGSRRVFRGGSWNFSAGGLRCADRYYSSPGDRDYDLGFRLLRTP